MKQSAFISGSARGIGHAIARELARSGFNIAVNDLSENDELHASAEAMRGFGVDAIAIAGDASDPDLQDSLLARAETAIGPLTTLVCNAGVAALQRNDVLDTTVESFDHCFTHNAKGPYFLMQAFARRLLARPKSHNGPHRSIIVISSISAAAASVNRGDYCVSKAGAAMAAKVFAARLAGEGIQVADIQPGVIATEMTRQALPNYQRRIDEDGLTLEPRLGRVEDVARVAAAVATGGLPYMVGPVLRVDGGLALTRL